MVIILGKPADAFPMQIHRRNTVVVRPIATALAQKQVTVLIPIRFFHMPAFRTCLAGIGRIELYNHAAGSLGLVFGSRISYSTEIWR